jgi:alcohol dehydrogenase (NADP+)
VVPKTPLSEYLSLLRVHGTFVTLGAPEDVLPPINAFSLILKNIKIGGSLIGPPSQIREMLQFAADKNLHPIIQKRPMSEANQAIMDLEKGLARYRYVLVNEN